MAPIGAAIAIVLLGALLASHNRADPIAEAYGIGLTAVGLIAVALVGMAIAPRGAQEVRREADQAIDAALEHVITLIGDYAAYNLAYRQKIEGLNGALPALPSRQDVQDIIVSLISRNMEMQDRVLDLVGELEQSRVKILSLRSDITEIEKLAMLDSLTSLANRRMFDQTLGKEIAQARASGTELCLAIGDLDRFKSVNDRFGHVVGDNLLKLFAELLTRNIRPTDLAARYGGEEFALLLPNTRIHDAARIADSIRRQLETRRWLIGASEEPLDGVTVSFGLARLAPQDSAESLFGRADAKLYEAKASGRNRVAIDERRDIDMRNSPASRAVARG